MNRKSQQALDRLIEDTWNSELREVLREGAARYSPVSVKKPQNSQIN